MIPPAPLFGYSATTEVYYGRADSQTHAKDLGFHLYSPNVLTVPQGYTYIDRSDGANKGQIGIYKGGHQIAWVRNEAPDAEIVGWWHNSAVITSNTQTLLVGSGRHTKKLHQIWSAAATWDGASVVVTAPQKPGEYPSDYLVTQTLRTGAKLRWTITGQLPKVTAIGGEYLCLRTARQAYILDANSSKRIYVDPDLELAPGPTPDTFLATQEIDLPHGVGSTQILLLQLPGLRAKTLATLDGYVHLVASGPTVAHPILLLFPHSHGTANLEELQPDGRLKTLQSGLWQYHAAIPGAYTW